MSSPVDTLRQLKARERQTRRDLIVEAARRVFGQKGVEGARMAEIATAAGIAKSSIYTYFPNQEALFVEAAYRDTERFITDLEQAVEAAGGRDLGPVVQRFIAYCTENEAYWRMITRFALSGEISGPAARKLDVVARRLMDVLERLFRSTPAPVEPRLLAHTLFAAVSGILIAFRHYPGRSDAEARAHMQRVGAVVQAMFAAYLDAGRSARDEGFDSGPGPAV